MERNDGSAPSERILTRKADPITALEIELARKIKGKFIALYGAERAAQVEREHQGLAIIGRIKHKFIALYGAERAAELAGDRWEEPSLPRSSREDAPNK